MITTEKLGRLPLRGTVLRSFGLSRFASHRFAPLPHIAGASVDLRCLNDTPAPPPPAPWWIKHSELLAAAASLLIFLFAGHAVGEF